MNRAVQARLENPDMPLYHALRIGGFNFPANEDVSTLDNDRVTLGQRKNQLLRRLRQIARRQEREEIEKARQQAQGQARLPGDQNQAEQLYPQPPQDQLSLLKLQPEQFQPINFELPSTSSSRRGSSISAPERRRSSLLDTGISGDGAGNQKEDWWNSMSLPQNSLHASLAQNQIQHVLNKQVERQLQSSSYTTGNRLVLPTEVRTFDHLASPLEDSVHPLEPQPPIEDRKPFETSFQRQGQNLLGIGAFPLWPNTTPQHPAPQDPAATLNALASPAASGQPAAALAVSTTSPSAEARETAALRYFQQGLQSLYTRSMLSAGYAHEETSENSPAFRQFAFNAWKQECERLQSILGDDQVGGSLATGAASAQNTALL
jgi:hypothetical protein